MIEQVELFSSLKTYIVTRDGDEFTVTEQYNSIGDSYDYEINDEFGESIGEGHDFYSEIIEAIDNV